MTVKIDVDMLRHDMKKTTTCCRENKRKVVEAQRALSACSKDADWKERRKLADAICKARSDAAASALTMTKLCVFRAHLRGRSHLSTGSGLLGFVKEWISEYEADYAMEDAGEPAEKPVA